MARDHGRIFSSIWSDRDFMAMSQEPQRFYIFLVTQSNLSAAGVLPVTARRWAASSSDLTPGEVYDLLDELSDRRFVVWDRDTEEVMIRTYLRYDKIYRQPNMMLKAVNDAAEIVSARIRLALLSELDRLPLDEVSDVPPKSGGATARQTVAECIQTLHRTLFAVDDKRVGSLPETVLETLPDTLPGTLNGPLSEATATMQQATDAVVFGVTEAQHASQHEPYGVTGEPAAWPSGKTQVSSGIGAAPEWVSGTLPETPNARAHARFPYPLAPSPNPENLSPSAGADGGVEAPKSKTGSRRAKPREHPRFAEFWIAYGHKVERLAAVKAFNQAIDGGADPDELIAAAGRYARRCKRLNLDRHKIKHASGWLNGERWNDEFDDDTPAPAGPNLPPHCGQCDPVDRTLLTLDNALQPCPNCHPDRPGARQ